MQSVFFAGEFHWKEEDLSAPCYVSRFLQFSFPLKTKDHLTFKPTKLLDEILFGGKTLRENMYCRKILSVAYLKGVGMEVSHTP